MFLYDMFIVFLYLLFIKILDATFDDLVPLAIPRMPSLAENLVVLTVREFTNLNIGNNLIQYPGPVLFIRRSNDEIIALE